MYCNHEIINNQCIDMHGINAREICIDACETQVRADITVIRKAPVKIWGQVRDQCCRPVPNTRLTLMKACIDACGQCNYQTIMHTVSGCDGFYCFEVCSQGEPACYKVFAERESSCPRMEEYNSMYPHNCCV